MVAQTHAKVRLERRYMLHLLGGSRQVEKRAVGEDATSAGSTDLGYRVERHLEGHSEARDLPEPKVHDTEAIDRRQAHAGDIRNQRTRFREQKAFLAVEQRQTQLGGIAPAKQRKRKTD